MLDLVFAEQGKIQTSTLNIAAHFGMAHKNVLQAIRNLEIPQEFNGLNFTPVEYTDSKGEKRPAFNITRDGFTILAMGFTGAKAMKFKLDYLAAFNRMEAALSTPKSHDQAAWKQARLEGKGARSDLTEAVQRLITYAKSQGSQSADMYYRSVTLMEYVALNFVAGRVDCKGLRDKLSGRHLAQLATLEDVCQKAIHDGIDQKMPYKDIFQYAKGKCIQLANAMNRIEKPFLMSDRQSIS